MKRNHSTILVAAVLLAAPFAWAGPPEVPAVHISNCLVVPFFEVDPGDEVRALFSIKTATGPAQLAHVQFWTECSEVPGRCYMGGRTVSLPPVGVKSFVVATEITEDQFLCDNGEFPGTVVDPGVYAPAFGEDGVGRGWVEICTVDSCAVVPPGHPDYPAVDGDIFGYWALLNSVGGSASAAPFVEARAGVFYVPYLTGAPFDRTLHVGFGDAAEITISAYNEAGALTLEHFDVLLDGLMLVDVGAPVADGGFGLTGFGTVVYEVAGGFRAGALVDAEGRYSEFIAATVTEIPAEPFVGLMSFTLNGSLEVE